MGRACDMNGEQGRCIQDYGVGDLMERDHLEDLGVDGRIILQWIFKTWDGVGMDWIDLAQDKDGWRAGDCECSNKPSSSINCGEFLD
jgi:hypothetical protein